MMGPMSGEINMAPITTAVEFTFNPTDAMRIAQTRINMLVPRNTTPLSMAFMATCGSSASSPRRRKLMREVKRMVRLQGDKCQ